MFFFSVQLMAESQNAPNAVLYYSPTCGHCKKVLAYLEQEHKTVTLKNVTDQANSKDYKALGTSGVPVLVVNGQIISGADGIINYFKQHPEVLR